MKVFLFLIVDLIKKNIYKDDKHYLKQMYMMKYVYSEYPYKKELYKEIVEDLIYI